MSNEMKIDSVEMKIDAALANLESGKFSFRMVEAIKDHIDKLEAELEAARGLHASAIRELKLRDYANWRLEAELRKLNRKIYALLRANMLVEAAYSQTAAVVIQMAEYFEAFKKYAEASLETTIAGVKEGKFSLLMANAAKDRVEVLRGHLSHILLKAEILTRRAYQEMTPLAIKAGECFEILARYAGASFKKTIAGVKEGKFSHQIAESIKDDVEFFRELLSEKSSREMMPVSVKTGGFFKKYTSSSFEKVTAYLSALHKTAFWQKSSNSAGRERIFRSF